MKIQDSIILVTGANRGIGKAYVEEFLKAGAKKIYMGVRNLGSVADLMAEHPGRLVALPLDVTKAEDIRNAAETAKDITILVNNAGALSGGGLTGDQDMENARLEMEVNYFGLLSLMQVFAPVLKANGGGQIVNLSSIAGLVSFPGLPTYSASKAAVHFITQSARTILAAQGTKVLGVYPGPIDTDMAKDIDLPKDTPQHVAERTVKAIEEGAEDLLPDSFAEDMYEQYLTDPKAMEGQMQVMYEDMMAEAA